jgi:hypothetical protein
MKTKSNFINSRSPFFLVVIIFAIFSTGKIGGQTENTNTEVSPDDKVVAMINSFNYNHISTVITDQGAGAFSNGKNKRAKTIQSLLEIFNNSKSYIFRPKCYAAYYLGVLRASEAVDSLAAQIKIRGYEHGLEEPVGGYEPAVDALVAIGNPSIPAVIRNLAESDDAKVRELSLQVVTRIDGDKDISQLRLQKALKAETDSQKQARLQAASKALAELK